MKITFGMYLDGAPWSYEAASVGELQLGPFGMLGLLETRLGLGGPEVHPAARINQYLQRLEACDRADACFHGSLRADGWSTAKQMLAWRDELIEAGWENQAEPTDTPRLRALAELERVDLYLAPGRTDRLREVVRHIERTPSLDIASIFLFEPLALVPAIWQKVFGLLREKGVDIQPVAGTAFPPQTSNLAVFRSVLGDDSASGDGQKKETLASSITVSDDSLVLISAADEWEAAENLALWLAADRSANAEVTIICGADTDVLDQALDRHGLPRLGGSEASRWRASLQVLPLVIANAWKPVDVRRLVELLSLPTAPIPRYAVRHLLRALKEEPGVGGTAWNKALLEIAAEHEENAGKKGKPVTIGAAAAFAAELDAMLATDRYTPETGIPEDKLKQRCQWVIEWLAWRAENEPMMTEAVSHAREMQKLATGKGTIPRIALERMLDSVIGVGAVAPDRFAQAAPWRVVSHGGQITRPSGTVVWWGFTEPDVNHFIYWSKSERRSLRRFDIELPDSRKYRALEARAWMQALKSAQNNLLLFYPNQIHGEPVYRHPLWDEIESAVPDQPEDNAEACLTRECSRLQRAGSWQLAGRTTTLQKAGKAERAVITGKYVIPNDTVAPPASLSYSQMNTILGCPMKWALHYHAGLRMPDTLSIPTGNQMIGTFCHRIIQELYALPDRQWSPQDARDKALELYDLLVVSIASELLLSGKELDNQRYRSAIGNAVKLLVTAINEHELKVEAAEKPLEGDLKGILFKGKADLLLRDKNGHLFVLDLKWSGSSGYRKEAIKEGSALQLAAYAWMLRSADDGRWAQSGYFMLAQGDLLSDSDLFGDIALTSNCSLEEIWEMGVEHLSARLIALSNGTVEAGGVIEQLMSAQPDMNEKTARAKLRDEYSSQGLLYQAPSCGFCDFSALCGLAEGA